MCVCVWYGACPSVCACVCSLSNLESLELRENLIKYLPASLSCLVKLKTLDLGSNLIDELVCLVSLFHRTACICPRDQCRINHVADVANSTGLRPQGGSGIRDIFFSTPVVK